MVSTVPEPSPSIAPPSSTQSAFSNGRTALRANRSPMSWSPSRSYLPPQPLNPKPRARRSFPDPRMIGPVSRSQMSPKGSTITLAHGASRRALSAAPSCAATSHTCSPRPPACNASANAATSRSAGLRSPSHSSGSLGKPTQTASCGAHSGRGGRGERSLIGRAANRPPRQRQAAGLSWYNSRALCACRKRGSHGA